MKATRTFVCDSIYKCALSPDPRAALARLSEYRLTATDYGADGISGMIEASTTRSESDIGSYIY